MIETHRLFHLGTCVMFLLVDTTVVLLLGTRVTVGHNKCTIQLCSSRTFMFCLLDNVAFLSNTVPLCDR